jgi:amino-acid N-acetyltransferase
MLRVSASRPDIRRATATDLGAIRAFLETAGLPAADLDAARPAFLVARVAGELVGVGGVEAHGVIGLLRSVAVAPAQRRSGLGREIVARLEQESRAAGLRELILLTETAGPFFKRLGYRVIDRAAAPEAIQASAEFRTLCPQSAVCMLKSLATAVPFAPALQ